MNSEEKMMLSAKFAEQYRSQITEILDKLMQDWLARNDPDTEQSRETARFRAQIQGYGLQERIYLWYGYGRYAPPDFEDHEGIYFLEYDIVGLYIVVMTTVAADDNEQLRLKLFVHYRYLLSEDKPKNIYVDEKYKDFDKFAEDLSKVLDISDEYLLEN